jgi:hypothetical protein
MAHFPLTRWAGLEARHLMAPQEIAGKGPSPAPPSVSGTTAAEAGNH